MALEQIIDTFTRDIENGEFNIAALIGGEFGCDWSYSVGLHRCFGHAELLIVGLDAAFTGALLEQLGSQIAEGRVIAPGDEVTVVEGFTLRTQAVDPLWLSMGEWFALGQAVMSHWGMRWPATIQLLWADASGRYPERSGDPYWMLRQPLLSAQRCNA